MWFVIDLFETFFTQVNEVGGTSSDTKFPAAPKICESFNYFLLFRSDLNSKNKVIHSWRAKDYEILLEAFWKYCILEFKPVSAEVGSWDSGE